MTNEMGHRDTQGEDDNLLHGKEPVPIVVDDSNEFFPGLTSCCISITQRLMNEAGIHSRESDVYKNKTDELGNYTEGGMAATKPYQNNDIERDLPLLEVRCTQNENDKSVNNSVQGKEDKLDDFDVIHLESVRPAKPESYDQARDCLDVV